MESEIISFQLLWGGGEEVGTHFNKMLDIYRHSSQLYATEKYLPHCNAVFSPSIQNITPPTPDLKYATVYSS